MRLFLAFCIPMVAIGCATSPHEDTSEFAVTPLISSLYLKCWSTYLHHPLEIKSTCTDQEYDELYPEENTNGEHMHVSILLKSAKYSSYHGPIIVDFFWEKRSDGDPISYVSYKYFEGNHSSRPQRGMYGDMLSVKKDTTISVTIDPSAETAEHLRQNYWDSGIFEEDFVQTDELDRKNCSNQSFDNIADDFDVYWVTISQTSNGEISRNEFVRHSCHAAFEEDKTYLRKLIKPLAEDHPSFVRILSNEDIVFLN